MGIDAIPPPASGLPARLVLGPALRAQSDRRLVRLVREGYESAFEEIVRRYRRPLDRFAAGIVGGRSEDVTQDSFRKALEALRHGDSEVELRPWLYRIVRNTALNDLRDRPPAAAELAEDLIGGGRSAAAEAEERAEVAALTARLRELPENQRAALVMRELEGMSHEEIAAALGISGGAARQAIARARTAVRSGFGALVPLPLLRALAGGSDGAAELAAGAGGAAAGGAAVGGSLAGGSAAVVGGGFGAGALKVGLATIAVAGSIGAGVAIDHHGGDHSKPEAARSAPAPGGPSTDGVRATPSPVLAVDDHGSGAEHEVGDDHGGRGHGDGAGPSGHGREGHGAGHRGDHGSGGGPGSSGDGDDGASHQGTSGGSGSYGGSRHGSSRDGSGQSGSDDRSGSSGGSRHGSSGDGSGGSGSGRSGSEDGGSRHGSGSGGSGDDSSHSGSGGGSGSGSSTSTGGGHGSDDATSPVVETEIAAPSSSGGSESSTSGSSGGSGGSGGSSSGDDSSSDGSELTLESSSSGGSVSSGGSGSSGGS